MRFLLLNDRRVYDNINNLFRMSQSGAGSEEDSSTERNTNDIGMILDEC